MALITSCCDAMRNHEHQMALITSHAPGLTDPGHAGARLALRARQVLGARPSPPRTLVFRPAEHLFQTPVRFLCPASCSSPLLSLSLSLSLSSSSSSSLSATLSPLFSSVPPLPPIPALLCHPPPTAPSSLLSSVQTLFQTPVHWPATPTLEPSTSTAPVRPSSGLISDGTRPLGCH